MWDKLTPADIERARHQLRLIRTATLSRHAAEIEILDKQQAEIQAFEHAVTAFAEKYLHSGPTSQPTEPDAPSRPAVPWDVAMVQGSRS